MIYALIITGIVVLAVLGKLLMGDGAIREDARTDVEAARTVVPPGVRTSPTLRSRPPLAARGDGSATENRVPVAADSQVAP